MTFAYHAGADEPNYSGLFEIPAKSLRICDVPTGSPLVQPSFHPLVIPPLVSSVPIRYNVTPIPRGGASVSAPLVDSWQFDVTGWFLMEDVNDVGGAFGYLCDVVCVANGWMSAQLDDPSWSERRTMTVQKGGPVTYAQNPEKGEMAAGYREFVLPWIAADPIKYALSDTTVTITTSTPVTNAGNARVPFVVRFDGPVTDHIQLDGPLGDATLLFDHPMSSGDFVLINTRDGSYQTNMVLDLYPYIAIGSDIRLLNPGTNTFTKSSGGGGTAQVVAYSGWE